MKLILAQGNPGAQYAHTRHNVGFFVIDTFAKGQGIEFTNKPKFHAEIAEGTIHGEKVLLVKPTTYYNETGQAAQALIDFYKLSPAEDLLVICDELALPSGTIRTRNSGGDAGNNGIKSLNAHLGDQYARVRIGIATPHRELVDDADFVLGKFTPDEKNALPAIYQQTERFVHHFIQNHFAATKVTVPTSENAHAGHQE